VDSNTLERLKELVLERLEQHPGLKQIYSSSWVEEQFSQGPSRGFHPVVRILLGFTLGEKPATARERAWLVVSGQSEPGDVKSRCLGLTGGIGRPWEDNHRDWWSSIAELYLAAHLVGHGYAVRLQDSGPDLALFMGNSECLGCVEVHSPRQTLGDSEFSDQLFWALRDRTPLDLRLTAKPSWDRLPLSGPSGATVAEQIAQLADTIASDTILPTTRRLTFTRGFIDVEFGPGRNGYIGYDSGAGWVGPELPSALFDDIVGRAQDKEHQLMAPPRWTILALEVAAYHTIPLYIHLFGRPGGTHGAFPTERLPDYVAALVIYAVDLTDIEPHAALGFRNPHSPWAQDSSLLGFLRLFPPLSR
jgi:hypothetical protein